MFEELQTRIGYPFRDANLLKLALTHRSLAREDAFAGSNQRLEFLGDAVLGLAIAHLLYRLYPAEDEGDLSKRLVGLVNGERLAAIAGDMGLSDCILMGGGEEEQGGRTNPSNLEDACEALLGAVYLDGGLPAVEALVARYWQPYAESAKTPPKDPKTALQEWVQARSLPLPEYVVLSSDGPSHAPHFVVEVRVPEQKAARGEAGNKKLAERLAAEAMLGQLGV